MKSLVLATLLLCVSSPFSAAADGPKAEIVEVRKIWDEAPHNAFTDLIRFRDRWYCVFREGQGHVSPDGALRVIVSDDGAEWKSLARITSETADLRDAKVTVAPDDRLMLSGAAALHQPADARHQSLVWYSKDGTDWGEPIEIGDPDFWIWRTTWHRDVAWGIGYATAGPRMARLYRSENARTFESWVEKLFDEGYPNETSMVFLEDDTALCLLRRDGEPDSAQLGTARPPYKDWTWKSLGTRVGGPHMIRLPDDRFVAAGRSYDGGARTRLWWLNVQDATLEEIITLPSGGDTSYPGLVWHEGLLWVSYYSSHEGKSNIYLAKIRLPEK